MPFIPSFWIAAELAVAAGCLALLPVRAWHRVAATAAFALALVLPAAAGRHAAVPSLPTPPDPALIRARLPAPVLTARSAILIDAVSGQVLYSLNPDERLPMASTTKLMTALLFCEHTRPDEAIVASQRAAATRESSLHLKVGERVSAQDLLKAILLRSANDACVAAAEHVAGTEPAFVALMNARARELGCTNTHFANSHGLNAPDHYTSARDLALIARAASRNPRIQADVQIRHCVITRSMDKQDVTLRNHSRFLDRFPGADGLKTGWTVPAGHCYAGSATWHGWRLISVVLHSANYVEDTAALMKFGFYDYRTVPLAAPGQRVGTCAIAGGNSTGVAVAATQPVQAVIPKAAVPKTSLRLVPWKTAAPVLAGEPVGTLEVVAGGTVISSSTVIAMRAVPAAASIRLSAAGAWSVPAAFGGAFALVLVCFRHVFGRARRHPSP